MKLNEYTLFKYPDYTLPLAVKMNEVHQRYGLDILHVHYAVPHATAALLARQMAMFRGEPAPRVVTTLHGTDITLMGLDPNLQPIIEYSINSSCGVTAVSESLRKQTCELFVVNKEIKVIYNFFESEAPAQTRKEMRNSLGVREDEILVIHLSNLRPVKRVPDLPRVVAEVDRSIPLKLLVIAGGDFGPFAPLVGELGIEGKLMVKRNVLDIENYLQAADIGLFPSEDESFGMGILETMSFGHPVVATRAGGIPEVMEEGRTGWLHEVGDVGGMTRSVERLAREEKLRQELGEQARERAQARFSADRIVDQYIEYYREIIEENKREENI